MSYLGPKELKQLIEEKKCIVPFDETRIDGAAYELSLGGQVFLTDSESKKPEILDEKNWIVDINPGQFALLLTEEKITIPNDKIAFISIKASEKLKGLVNVSGFHVDPGFSGKLVFSVYNAGPSPITLRKGNPYFPIWFCEINQELTDEEAYNKKKNHHQNQSEIPPKYIEALKRGELASPNVLLEKITELGHIKNRNQWLLTFLIVLVAGVVVKMYWDWNSYDKGHEAGLKARDAQQEIIRSAKSEVAKAVTQYSFDSLFLRKVDSLVNERIKLKATEKKN